MECNRALYGDTVFVELLPSEPAGEDQKEQTTSTPAVSQSDHMMQDMETTNITGEKDTREEWWQDDPIQISLWDPLIPIPRTSTIATTTTTPTTVLAWFSGLPRRSGLVFRVTNVVFVGTSRRIGNTCFVYSRRIRPYFKTLDLLMSAI